MSTRIICCPRCGRPSHGQTACKPVVQVVDGASCAFTLTPGQLRTLKAVFGEALSAAQAEIDDDHSEIDQESVQQCRDAGALATAFFGLTGIQAEFEAVATAYEERIGVKS